MTLNRSRSLLPTSALAMLLAFGSAAQAQNLFETLFGGARRDQRQMNVEPVPVRPPAAVPAQQAAPRPKAAIQKIAPPSYRAYVADALVRVPFRRIIEAPVPASYDAAASGGFDEAVAGLTEFELLAEKEIAAALSQYYAEKRAFIWVAGTAANARAEEAVKVLGEAPGYGLDGADYAVALPGAAAVAGDAQARSAALIRFEMALSARALRYVRDAWAGRIDANRMSVYFDFPKKPLDLVEVLDRLAHTSDVRSYLESRHPQNDRYAALRAELAALHASAENDIVVDGKLLLKPGESSPELRKMLTLFYRQADDAVLAQHGAVLAAYQAGDRYVKELVPAVKAMQELKGLKPDGIIGPRTVAVFAGESKAARIAKVEVALEQLRWHPSDLGSPRVFINQPAFTATWNDGGEDRMTMPVVIGTTTNQTSFFYDRLQRVEYNPYWGVPQSILVNEMLPRLRDDPGYLDRAGYEVRDSSGKKIPSASINWWAYGSSVPFNVRQTPSEANALGELKILFPNKHAIYMHDTPQKSFFQRDVRAYSHGCIRLSDPRGMAAAVLGTSVDHVAARIAAGHSSEKVTRDIPVYVAYFTAWPDQAGKVSYFADVYGRDDRVLKALATTAAARRPAS